MASPLELSFPDANHVVIRFGATSAGPFAFVDPLVAADHDDLRWYLEVYAARSLGEPDNVEAARIAAGLPGLGQALFRSVFHDAAARALFDEFRRSNRKRAGLLTVSTRVAAILRLPWELLHEPEGTYLFASSPGIRIRRRLLAETESPTARQRSARNGLHILFVVSRPLDASFLDPRLDCAAVMDALEAVGPGKTSWEFLYPATVEALSARLADSHRRPVNVLHFDGHGVFDTQGQTGYLLFESAASTRSSPTSDPVSADRFASALEGAPDLALVILSACQSATQTQEGEPLGSVAARVAAAGMPAVIAMTHSVLTATTRQLFETFYRQLAHGATVGTALAAARVQLYTHPNRYKISRWSEQRGTWQEWLKLHDWCVPTLYQTGADISLVSSAGSHARKSRAPGRKVHTNLPPAPATGFFGRAFELWLLERGLVGHARRMTVAGFGGLGKTTLAQETGRWLLRTGKFDAAIFVDFSRLQVLDAVPLAVSQIAKVLRRNLPNSEAARQALDEIPTLVVLDGLESLPAEALDDLLRCATTWSEAGSSRVLFTTRPKSLTLRHESLATHRGAHQRVELEGLGWRDEPDDALEWFAALWLRPPHPRVPMPDREALIALFDRVHFHPLSILVLAQQLKHRAPAELGSRLEQLLHPMSDPAEAAADEMSAVLLASLKLSLERLTPEDQQAVRRLGVFHGGAYETVVLAITGLGDASEGRRAIMEQILARLEQGDTTAVAAYYTWIGKSPEDLTPPQLLQELEWVRKLWRSRPQPNPDRSFWPRLLAELRDAALVRVEDMTHFRPDRFLEFHPTLAPLLWELLEPAERTALSAAHRDEYWQVLLLLSQMDRHGPQATNELVMRELPNLMAAVETAFATRAEFAEHMARHLGEFLVRFGLRRDYERLRALVDEAEPDAAEHLATELARAQELEEYGELQEALKLYHALIMDTTDDSSYAPVDIMLGIARCLATQGWFNYAALALLDAGKLAGAIPEERVATVLQCHVQIELADFAARRGDYVTAEREYLAAYEKASAIVDAHALFKILCKRASLARRMRDFPTALQHFEKAHGLAELIKIEARVADVHVGMAGVYLDLEQWDEAEDHLRAAAPTYESLSDPHHMVAVWSGLAIACSGSGRVDAARDWARKAIAHFATRGSQHELCTTVTDLARVLLRFPDRVSEARRLVRQAVITLKRWDDVTTETWKVYSLMARLSAKQARNAASSARRQRLVALARRYSLLAVRAKRVSTSRATREVPEHHRRRPSVTSHSHSAAASHD